MPRSALPFVIPHFVLCIPGCAGIQSALDPAGPQAGRISNLWWLFFAVCLIVFLVVIGCLLYAAGHRRREAQPEEPQAERRRVTVVSTAVAITILVLFIFLVASVRTGNLLSKLTSSDA